MSLELSWWPENPIKDHFSALTCGYIYANNIVTPAFLYVFRTWTQIFMPVWSGFPAPGVNNF